MRLICSRTDSCSRVILWWRVTRARAIMNAGGITAVARSAEKAADLGVRVHVGDYDRPESLAGAFAAGDVRSGSIKRVAAAVGQTVAMGAALLSGGPGPIAALMTMVRSGVRGVGRGAIRAGAPVRRAAAGARTAGKPAAGRPGIQNRNNSAKLRRPATVPGLRDP